MRPAKEHQTVALMRGLSLLLGFLFGFMALWATVSDEPSNPWGVLAAYAITAVFVGIYIGLGERKVWGYRFAQAASVLLLLGFPILTVRGIYFLAQFSTPEAKQIFHE